MGTPPGPAGRRLRRRWKGEGRGGEEGGEGGREDEAGPPEGAAGWAGLGRLP